MLSFDWKSIFNIDDQCLENCFTLILNVVFSLVTVVFPCFAFIIVTTIAVATTAKTPATITVAVIPRNILSVALLRMGDHAPVRLPKHWTQ